MNSDAKHKSRLGVTLIQLAVTVAVLLSSAGGTYTYLHRRALATEAAKNLRVIYMALRWYEMENGQLPDLAFFPADPRNDDDSLLYALGKYGVTEQITVCPSAPATLQAEGLNYLWNARLSKKKLHEIPAGEWMLVEIHALSPTVPRPHLGKYTILRANGQVEFSREPPPGVPI